MSLGLVSTQAHYMAAATEEQTVPGPLEVCYRIVMLERYRLVVVRRIPLALFTVAVPLFLLSVSVTWAMNDLRLYEHGFDTYDVPAVTGIQREDLIAVARQLRGYFNSTTEPLEVRTRIHGEERELFNEREVLHMRDVKRLVWGLYGVGAATGVYILGFAGVGLLFRRGSIGQTLAQGVLWGGGLTMGLVVFVGLLSVVGFDSLFLFFHRVSFSNDLWMLDPRSDYLIMMFPQGFWLDATIFVALATVGQALVLLGTVGGLLLLRRWKGRRGQRLLARHPV